MKAAIEYPVTLVVAKTGDLVWLGHLDFARAIERSLRRSGLPLRFTEGFHKRVKLRLPEPLPLGVGSEGERFVVPLAEARTPTEVQAALDGTLPRGLPLKEVIEGFHPEPKDAPIELLLEANDLAVLTAAFAALPKALPAIGGNLEVVEPPRQEDPARGHGSATAVVRLVPPAGTRVSIGRFLALLNEAAPGSSAERPLVQARRRVAWHAEEVSLPSSARIAPTAPIAPSDFSRLGDQESSPCTP